MYFVCLAVLFQSSDVCFSHTGPNRVLILLGFAVAQGGQCMAAAVTSSLVFLSDCNDCAMLSLATSHRKESKSGKGIVAGEGNKAYERTTQYISR